MTARAPAGLLPSETLVCAAQQWRRRPTQDTPWSVSIRGRSAAADCAGISGPRSNDDQFGVRAGLGAGDAWVPESEGLTGREL